MRVRSLAYVVALFLFALGARDARANNWPPARGADMKNPANWPNDPDYVQDWNYWSWLPMQNGDAKGPYLDADTKLGASGIHADVAWTYTIGRPDVKIAVIDSGIEWDDADLANKAYLNAGELGASKAPRNAMGTPCAALTPASAGYDCDGDGVFTVADYRDDPRISPPAMVAGCPGGMSIQGDKNQNCILDAGDLIDLFSDGVDDDANGYTDDISGWDFYKNDNDPYDDTRYGHGTGEARDSSAEGNNALGGIGVCPDCRFIMLRAGDSFIADANDFAKGVVYATDNGAKVVQEALGTIDQTAFSKAAIDYAYAHGVTVVASMADENSRHHNMPAVTNHTLPVHAITHDGDILSGANGAPPTTSATTFIAYNTCSNYGAQNMLSVSGTACSSEATGKGAGAVGLLYSEAANKGLSLGAEEAMQLMKMTADIIDVPESTSPDPNVRSQFYESLPYFSQRFGYGRPNLDRAMQAIDAGLIPPEVDLVSPAWFQVLYADRTTAPVPIVGSVAAKRAQSYDYRVEWAPGVEPADTDFQPLLDWVRNVPATTATGGPNAPLAMLAPAQIDTSHTPDPDSARFHENDRTITLRVVAIAHYPGHDVRGEARRAVAIVNAKNGLDPDLVQGFPIAMGASIETSPKLADIDGDGVRDVVAAASDGSVHVLSMKTGVPVDIAGFPFRTNIIDGLNANLTSEPSVPSYLTAPAYANGAKAGGIDPGIAREAIIGSPAVADLNDDGKNEIVVSTWSGTVYVIGPDGQPLAGWPKRLPLVPSCPLDPSKPKPAVCMDTHHGWARGAGASPVLADFDHDGRPEIVQAAFDGNVYIWHSDGTPLAGWPVLLHDPQIPKYNRILSTPAVADFNGDGVPDVLCGSNEEVPSGPNTLQGGSGPVFLVDGRGMNAPGGKPYMKDWPIVITSLHEFPVVAEGIDSAPAAADFVGSGHPQALIQGNVSPPYIFPLDPGPQPSTFNDPPNRLPVYHTDAGATQVGLDPSSIFGDGSKAFRPDTMLPLFSQPSVGDLDQDGVPDVVMSGGSLSLAGNLAGGSTSRPFQHLLAMWSVATGHMTWGSPVPIEDYVFLMNHAVADITGDDYPEVLLGTGGYFVHAVDACGCEAPSWPKFTDGWLIATPAVGDIDGDHKLEVVDGTRDGYLFAWHTQGTDTGVIQWESYHHDNANTGDYGHTLDQGAYELAAHPLDCSLDSCAAPTAAAASSYSPGGCACDVAGGGHERSRTGGRLGWLAAVGLGAALARRRSRKRERAPFTGQPQANILPPPAPSGRGMPE